MHPNFSKMLKSSILDKQKSIVLMERVSASSKIHIKLSTDNSIMVSLKVRENFTLQLETTMLVNLDLIKRKVEEFILGLEKKAMFIKDSLRREKEMVEVLFGGQMEAGMKEISEMVFKVDGEFFIEKEGIVNTKVTGIMVCLMEKAPSISKMVSDMKVPLSKISSMVKVYFIKMIR